MQTASKSRGSALMIIVVISLVISGLVMTMAWSSGLQAQSAGALIHEDEAFYAADSALQWALLNYKADPTWPINILGTNGTTIKVGPATVTAWSCLVTYTDMGSTIGMSAGVLGNPLQFKAVATRTGLSARGVSAATATGVLTYTPQFYVASNLSVAESATINGDVQTQGNLTVNAPTSGNVVSKGAKGTWKAKGTVTDNNPSGATTYFTSSPVGNTTVTSPSMTATKVYQTMMAGSTISINSVLEYNSSTGHYILDFSKAGGKPVVLAGNTTYNGNVEIIQSSTPANDTFIVNGNCTFTGTFPANASSAKMNLVVNGDVVFNGSGTGINITGSFYATGNYTQQGAYSFNGIVMSDKTSTIAGTGTIGNTSAPPTFDPRYAPKFTAYVGDLP